MSFIDILCVIFGHRFQKTWIITEGDFIDAKYCRVCGLVKPEEF
jgi:hypothetical protein